MYETRNETNRRPVTCGERKGSDDLTFRPLMREVESGFIDRVAVHAQSLLSCPCASLARSAAMPCDV
jgi:hypothetical protein